MNDYFIVAEDNFSGKRIEAIISAENPYHALLQLTRDFPRRDVQGNAQPMTTYLDNTLKFADVYADQFAYQNKERPLETLLFATSECEEIRREAQVYAAGIALNNLRGFLKFSTGHDVLGEKWSN
ncbi:hypothetical protein HZA97_01885 [Candidatus Woesearchaeota archaeon]|nr:hypothetical protein [Candidatus Woesearchaeota archaeon]